MTSYPSWVLLDGNQIVAHDSGLMTYEELKSFASLEPVNYSNQMVQIVEYLEHWKMGHISDGVTLETICGLLEHDCDVYYVNHSSKTYIIDQDGNMRVVWRGYDWTYASIYHDIAILL